MGELVENLELYTGVRIWLFPGGAWVTGLKMKNSDFILSCTCWGTGLEAGLQLAEAGQTAGVRQATGAASRSSHLQLEPFQTRQVVERWAGRWRSTPGRLMGLSGPWQVAGWGLGEGPEAQETVNASKRFGVGWKGDESVDGWWVSAGQENWQEVASGSQTH